MGGFPPGAGGATLTLGDMTDAVPLPLASGPRQMNLLAVDRVPEDSLPAAYALVALRHADRLLMVHVRDRCCWELPGGRLEPGETAREGAVRELYEETGQRVDPEALRFAGYVTTAIGPEQRVLRGALFTGETEAPTPFAAGEEIAEIHWLAEGAELPASAEVQTVDVYLAALTHP